MSLQRYSFVKCESLKDPNGRWVLFEDLQKQQRAVWASERRSLSRRQTIVFVIVVIVSFVSLCILGIYREGITWGWW